MKHVVRSGQRFAELLDLRRGGTHRGRMVCLYLVCLFLRLNTRVVLRESRQTHFDSLLITPTSIGLPIQAAEPLLFSKPSISTRSWFSVILRIRISN